MYALAGQQQLLGPSDDPQELVDLAKFSESAVDGDSTELGYQPPAKIWRLAQSDPNNCQGRRCPHFAECFFYQARRKIEDADLLIVNHHLYFSDLALRDQHSGICRHTKSSFLMRPTGLKTSPPITSACRLAKAKFATS